ncbi:hypothetical protein IG631_18741 [Alternaria alternata]|nr:hypothetical protein IG631_18741 [Alternaria alternata]
MVQLLPYVASLLALGQAVAATKAVTSFSEWVDGILENPDGDNMTPEEVVVAFKSGEFNSSPSAMTLLVAQDLSWMLALFQVVIGCKGRNLHTEMEQSWCDFGDLDYRQ